MSIEEHKTLIQCAVDAFNRGDGDAVDRLFSPDYVDHDRSRADLPPGPAGVKLAWAGFRAAFPDLHATIEDLVAAGDKVVVRGSIRGTHRGELMGIPPTGKPVTVTLIDVNRIEDGRLTERWAETDMLGMMQQLGVIPSPPAPEPAGGATPGDRSTTSSPGREAMTVEENTALVRRVVSAFQEVWRSGDFDLVDPLFAPDFINHTPGFPPNLSGFKQAMPMFRSAFPDLHIALEDLIAEDDRVAIRITNRGTHQGELMGIPPTGKAIAVSEMHLYRVADGKVVERWGEWGALDLMQQLGAIPPDAQPAA
jgi:steroid delta-isomerase-like uncharacterized protein